MSFLPTDLPIPALPNKQQILSRLPKIDLLYIDIEPAFEEFINSVNSTTYAISRAANGYKDTIGTMLTNFDGLPNLLPNDYDPPKYVSPSQNVTDLDSERQLHSNISEVRL